MKVFTWSLLSLVLLSMCSFKHQPASISSSKIIASGFDLEEKEKIAKEVFDNLKRALGLTQNDPPSFRLVEALPIARFSSAMILFEEKEIYLEEAAYQICQKFEADSLNALAVYLGHELAHFYRNHGVRNHFAIDFNQDLQKIVFDNVKGKHTQRVKDTIIKTLVYSMTQETEREADLDGGFLAYLAGYKTAGIGPRLLDETYKVFQINRNPKNYPSFEERVDIVKEVEKKLDTLINYFETGNMLIALQQYEDALFYYNKVFKDFQSRELYNNIGVLYTLSYLKEVDQSKIIYTFPLELDLKSRAGGRGFDEKDHLYILLQKAVEYFDGAISKDDDYPISHLNRGCAFALMAMHNKEPFIKKQQFAVAEAAAFNAIVLAQKDTIEWEKTFIDGHTLLGIIESIAGDSIQASVYFEDAIHMNPNDSTLASNNKISHLTKKVYRSSAPPINSLADHSSIEETIDNKRLIDFSASESIVISEDHRREVHFYKVALNNSSFLANQTIDKTDFKEPERVTYFHITSPGYPDTTALGIKLDDSIKTITDKGKYGTPDFRIELGHGSWLVYKNPNIIFEFGVNGKLMRWCIYKQDYSF